jgi:hypothetical protein
MKEVKALEKIRPEIKRVEEEIAMIGMEIVDLESKF